MVNFRFPEYFPPLDNFIAADDRLYVKTYKRDKKKDVEFIVLDLQGNVEGTVFLPRVRYNRYTVKNGVYYYLEENETNEQWELISIKLKQF